MLYLNVVKKRIILVSINCSVCADLLIVFHLEEARGRGDYTFRMDSHCCGVELIVKR